MMKFNELVRSRETAFPVIPADPGTGPGQAPESSIFKSLLILWTPVFTGVTTFYENNKFNDSGFLLRRSLFLVRYSAVRF